MGARRYQVNVRLTEQEREELDRQVAATPAARNYSEWMRMQIHQAGQKQAGIEAVVSECLRTLRPGISMAVSSAMRIDDPNSA